jgi:hypothetical protein
MFECSLLNSINTDVMWVSCSVGAAALGTTHVSDHQAQQELVRCPGDTDSEVDQSEYNELSGVGYCYAWHV